jgi:dihydroorotate dehydrogenase electron transfer subunit
MGTEVNTTAHEIYTIAYNVPIARQVFRMRLIGDTSAIHTPGQFANIKIDGLFLRRPISIADWDGIGFDIIYKVVGDGTDALSHMKVGGALDALVGLGSGYDVDTSSHPLIIGGGVGVPPLFGLAKQFIKNNIKPKAILGFLAEEDIILADEMRALGCEVAITLDVNGKRVTDALPDMAEGCDEYFACGPIPMLKAVFRACPLPGQLSLEARMACGLGLCQGCSCGDAGGQRICVNGPVFRKEELVWQI